MTEQEFNAFKLWVVRKRELREAWERMELEKLLRRL